MESYLKPLLAELEKRARLSQEIYLLLQEYLQKRTERPINALRLNKLWAFDIRSEDEEDLAVPRPSTEYGVPLKEYITIGLFLASWMDEDPDADIIPVLDIYIAENGTVINGPVIRGFGDTNPDGTFEDDRVAVSYVELNSAELVGLKNDLIGITNI